MEPLQRTIRTAPFLLLLRRLLRRTRRPGARKGKRRARKGDKGKGKGSNKGKSKGENPCFTMVNNGSCNKPDCPYNHEEEFIESFKVYKENQKKKSAKIDSDSTSFDGGADAGRGGFVALRAAMPVVPINPPAAKSSMRTASSTSPSRPSKVTFDEWNLREELNYPWKEKSTGDLMI